ncbi:hypothetical protein QR680_013027 [Steinernema hermaphroditum]|uniref:Uncharacterized protein n=1 Tax=Steinernema hermaphroditum TaxID=289476 RepID=A0AA39M0X0_9BILA|nr:hypothetical protein QR680_013027 [Steinernema hermaphroditum]
MSQVASTSSSPPKKRTTPKSASSSAKDDLDNIQVKKRIRVSEPDEASQKTTKAEAFDFPKSSIQDVLRSEDEQLKSVCADNMRQIFSTEAESLLAGLKSFLHADNDQERSKHGFYDECIDKVMKMRYAHRMSLLKTEERNEELLAERAAVDKEFRAKEAARVRLFNVRNEIESCLDIRAPEEDCDLLPMPDFLDKFPSAKVTEDMDVRDRKHQERLARLKWELEERQGLQEKLQELENRRDVLVTDIGGKESRITSMMPMFEKIREAAKPLYELMGPSSIADAIADHCEKFFDSLPKAVGGSPQPEEASSRGNTPPVKMEEEDGDGGSDTASVTSADDEDAASPESVMKEEESDGEGDNRSDIDKEVGDEEIVEVDSADPDHGNQSDSVADEPVDER